MAALQYKDDHNRIAYLGRERGSEDFTDICRRLEKDHLQRVERADDPDSAATTQPAADPDSAGGSSFHPARSATPMSGSAVPDTAGGPLDTTGTASTVPTSAAMDSAASHHELGIS
ncbi:hypothetical protein Tco_1090347, partial [Tanacetum coccineum]